MLANLGGPCVYVVVWFAQYTGHSCLLTFLGGNWIKSCSIFVLGWLLCRFISAIISRTWRH